MNAKSIMVGSVTAALWLSCLAVGLSGEAIRYRWTPPEHKKLLPPARLIQVDLTDDPAPPPPVNDPSPAAQDAAEVQLLPPDAPQVAPLPPAPALTAVATPSPEIQFAKPVEGPTQITNAKNAVPAAPSPPNATASPGAGPPSVQHLTFGRGAGAQPKPGYPREAIVGNEEGTVVVRFAVDESGKVTFAEVLNGCRWPLLNQAALLAVRDRWRFAPGPERLYDIAIKFTLNGR